MNGSRRPGDRAELRGLIEIGNIDGVTFLWLTRPETEQDEDSCQRPSDALFPAILECRWILALPDHGSNGGNGIGDRIVKFCGRQVGRIQLY